MLVRLKQDQLLRVLQADHSRVLIGIRMGLGTQTNVGASLLGATWNGVTDILRYEY